MINNNDLLNWTAHTRNILDKKSGFYAALMFLVWPIMAVISALKNYRSHWAKNVLWAFVAFYGFSFAIGTESQNSDIVRYVVEVEYLHGIKMSIGDAWSYYLQSNEIDILRTFIAVVVSRFTDSQAMLTLVYGTIFGFFFSRNVWYLLERVEGKLQPISILLLVCFFLVVPIWNINGFRMWTAAHIFIYGLLPFLFEGRTKGLAVASLAILVHYSFIVPLGILFIYVLLGNRLMIYFLFFLTTIFISEINLDVFNNIIESYAPEALQERTASYRAEQMVDTYRADADEGRNWYALWYNSALSWSIMGFLVVLYLEGREFFKKNEKWANLLSFTLLYFGVANLFNSLPSGGRFVTLAKLSALVLIILYVQNQEHEVVLKRFIWIAAPALLLFIIVALRIGFYSMSATAILGNPFFALFLTEHISLNDVVKIILKSI